MKRISAVVLLLFLASCDRDDDAPKEPEPYVPYYTEEASETEVTEPEPYIPYTEPVITLNPERIDSIIVKWIPPEQRTDGVVFTPLTDISECNIYYGTEFGTYSNKITVNDSTVTTYSINGLADGKYYVVVTCTDQEGRESRFSSEKMIDLTK